MAGPAVFLAVGRDNKAATSPDGINWTAQSPPASYFDVVWAPELELFFACNNGNVARTYDGTSWSSSTQPTTGSGIAWSPDLGLLVVVGTDGELATSPDGVSWTLRTSSFGTDDITSVTWASGLGVFLAGGAGGKTATSPDGINWTQQGNSTIVLDHVERSPELGLFVGTTLANNSIRTSPDATEWTARNSSVSVTALYEMAWSPELGLFVIGGASQTIITSPDGINWTARTSNLEGFGTAAAWSPDLGLFVVCDGFGPIVTSPDGVTWTKRTSTFGTSRIDGVAWAPLGNEPPNAPTLDYPDGVTIDLSVTNRFRWTFDDPDDGDSQSAYDLRYREAGSSAWTTVSESTPNEYRDIAGGTFGAGDWEWQVRTYDAAGEVGPWSATATFTAAEPTDPPTITAPTNGGTIDTQDFTVEWSTPVQDAYELRRVADDGTGSPDTSTVYFSTGVVESSSARSRVVEFETNLRDEHVQVSVRDDGLWSPWASVLATVSYTPPAEPTIDVAAADPDDPVSPCIALRWVNPAPSGSEPTVTSMEVWQRRTSDGGDGIRIAVGLSPGLASWRDRTVGSGIDYEHRVKAVGDNGTSSWSPWTSDVGSLDDL